MKIADLWRDPVPEPVVEVEEAPPPATATPPPVWECPNCGASVHSPPHSECQVCGTHYGTQH